MFEILLPKLILLFFALGLGIVLGKTLKLPAEPFAKLNIYAMVPLVTLGFVWNTHLEDHTLIWRPVIFFFMSSLMGAIAYFGIGRCYKDARRNLIGSTGSVGNVGYFGLPIVMALFPEDMIGLYFLFIFGGNFNEVTFSYYYLARGKYSPRMAIRKLLRLPFMYAFFAGVVLSVMHVPMPNVIHEIHLHCRSVYIISGMMTVGIAVSSVTQKDFDTTMILNMIWHRAVLWPLMMLGFLWLDQHYLGFFDQISRQMLFILAAAPLASNSVSYAETLGIMPQKMALAVTISTILACIYVPIYLGLFFH